MTSPLSFIHCHIRRRLFAPKSAKPCTLMTHFVSFNFVMALLMLFVATIIPVTTQATTNQPPAIQVDVTRKEYIDLEKALWQYLDKTGPSKAGKIRKIIESNRRFVNDNMLTPFRSGKFGILNHYEWTWLERDLLQIDDIFNTFKSFMNEIENTNEISEFAVSEITNKVLQNDSKFSISKTFENIELIMSNQTLYYRAMMAATDQICQTKQSAQQFVYSLYADIALTELKGYTMMEFSWMMLRLYGRGNFTQEAKLMREDYEKRTERTLKLLREVLHRADRIVWSCDPIMYVKGKTYDEVTRLLQGYIENEVDLNNDETCRETCDYYQSTRSEGCFKNKFCAQQPRCAGKIYNCQFIDSDMWVCPSSKNSTRRYEYIEYENGRVLGKRGTCTRGTSKVDSWWRYLFWHCSYCLCLCDEQGLKSDRYFNLRESVSDVENNRIVTGLRFVKVHRVFHMQIQEGDLLPRGSVNTSTLSWKPVDSYNIFDRDVRNGRDYHTLSYESRAIDLDDIHTEDIAYIVTGVRFRVLGKHLNLEARLHEFNFTSGKLINPKENFFWKSNDNTEFGPTDKRQKISVSNADMSSRSNIKSVPDSRNNQYIEFVNTDINKDVAQSTVPFIDIQDVTSSPPVPLSGIGIYHKGQPKYGGFIAPKIMTYDFTPHVQLPVKAKYENNNINNYRYSLVN